jgi:hypothetical protein
MNLDLSIGTLILTRKKNVEKAVENPEISTAKYYDVQNFIYSSLEQSMVDLIEFEKYIEDSLENFTSDIIDNVYKKGYQILLGIFRSFSNLDMNFKIDLLLTLKRTKDLFLNKDKETHTKKLNSEIHNYTSRLQMDLNQIRIYIKHLISFEKLEPKELVTIEEKSLTIRDRSSANDLFALLKNILKNEIVQIDLSHGNEINMLSNKEISFDEEFKKHFMIDSENYFNEKQKILQNKTTIYANENNILTQNFLIHCDLISEQLIGSEFRKLLAIIKPEGKPNDIIYQVFDNPNYLPVNKTFINTINISLTDENGSHLDFTEGEIILNLHFRKKEKKNEFLHNSSQRRINGCVPKKRSVKLHYCSQRTNKSCRRIRSRTRRS